MLDGGNGPSRTPHTVPIHCHHCLSAAIFKAHAGSRITFFSLSPRSPGQDQTKDPIVLWNLLPRDTQVDTATSVSHLQGSGWEGTPLGSETLTSHWEVCVCWKRSCLGDLEREGRRVFRPYSDGNGREGNLPIPPLCGPGSSGPSRALCDAKAGEKRKDISGCWEVEAFLGGAPQGQGELADPANLSSAGQSCSTDPANSASPLGPNLGARRALVQPGFTGRKLRPRQGKWSQFLSGRARVPASWKLVEPGQKDRLSLLCPQDPAGSLVHPSFPPEEAGRPPHPFILVTCQRAGAKAG